MLADLDDENDGLSRYRMLSLSNRKRSKLPDLQDSKVCIFACGDQ